jgi:DNA-directed RNA polymerase subunit beta
MPTHRYFLSDFVTIQRQSFFELLERGLIEEFSKRNPITNKKRDLELVFYPEYYMLTRPEYTPQEAIIKNKSYTSKLYVPGQLTDFKNKKKIFKWFYIGNIPLMTKRGHFILNGAARVIVNQILRSPGIYYQEKIYENYPEKWSQKPDDTYKRFYADLICMRGTWLRIEIDKEKNIWAQMKKGPKIPIYLFLLAMGVSEKKIFRTITEPFRLLGNLKDSNNQDSLNNVIEPELEQESELEQEEGEENNKSKTNDSEKKRNKNLPFIKSTPEAWIELYKLIYPNAIKKTKDVALENNSQKDVAPFSERKQPLKGISVSKEKEAILKSRLAEEGRKWLYNKFMNPRSYNLGKQGRLAFNKKLALNINTNQTTLTGLDVLYATDYLIKVEKGFFKIDDIDHLKNRRVRTSGELIQIQVGIGLVRLEKSIRENLDKLNLNYTNSNSNLNSSLLFPKQKQKKELELELKLKLGSLKEQKTTTLPLQKQKLSTSIKNKKATQMFNSFSPHSLGGSARLGNYNKKESMLFNVVNSKAFNSAIREFFGTSPLSQFMDQINPLAELTHKRRLSSMGPGGVTRDSATLAIRGIHPTHYGRICPIETPEGKNTGLVNSMTTYARVNSNGIIESPFYKVYKGQVQKHTGMYYFSAEHEEKIKLAAADLSISSVGFLPKAFIPVRISEDFTRIPRSQVEYVGVSPLQMISIATSLIPFLEHDDANRALMGSNMQRQAVPLIRPERPIVGTGLEARTISDSGHAITAKSSGFVTYVSSNKIVVYSFVPS